MHQKMEIKTEEAHDNLTIDADKLTERNDNHSTKKQPSNVPSMRSDDTDDNRPALETLDTSKLHRLIIQSERWRNYSFNMGYELYQFKKILTMCGDATIKVKRLLHNFEEKIKDT